MNITLVTFPEEFTPKLDEFLQKIIASVPSMLIYDFDSYALENEAVQHHPKYSKTKWEKWIIGGQHDETCQRILTDTWMSVQYYMHKKTGGNMDFEEYMAFLAEQIVI